MDRSLTISETIQEITNSLKDYIEATYHIGNPVMVEQRRLLLEEEGVLFRAPYIESTPRYQTSRRFSDLDLPEEAKHLLNLMAHPADDRQALLYDPPYTHQASALELSAQGKSLAITTGTGSGKTEAFLLPILSKLAIEAQSRPDSFRQPALRALLLYPMNALVNDQLGRLRLMLGNDLVAKTFTSWSGRPARFARYTSRTLYPGVRTVKKDQARLGAIQSFYVSLLETIADESAPHREAAQRLVRNLQRRGKWPAKPDLKAWYGDRGSRWKNSQGEFIRATMLPEDPELFTRHEVLSAPPDLLVTNYSMLEYMLMRPLERPIFDATRAWLESNPDEQLLLVIDEGHLYRGAGGAEVGLLLRRLRTRLGISPERLQVICTSASFNSSEYAREFAAQLSGKKPDDFVTLTGELLLRENDAKGTSEDAAVLARLSLDDLYGEQEEVRRDAISEFLTHRGIEFDGSLAHTLYEALREFPPISLLINLTMKEARPLGELGQDIFGTEDRALADRAVTALVALGSIARPSDTAPGLLPCRVHAFFRGLPGLWACLDPDCSRLDQAQRGGPVGSLYAQPQVNCVCGARVFELYTCRNCGAAYARGYTNDIIQPRFLWSEPGTRFEGVAGFVSELQPLDLMLEQQTTVGVEPADLDLVTGRLNPPTLGTRTRQVLLRLNREANETDEDGGASSSEAFGEFRPCGVCGKGAPFGRSSVQDHQTKGDQPFQALITRQIQVQPPSPRPYSHFAPLRGRKVLAFSDSRQTAARLAPNLQTYSMRDVLRPLVLVGSKELETSDVMISMLCLEDLYLAVLIGAKVLSVRLRPELRGTESLSVMRELEAVVDRGALSDPAEIIQLALAARSEGAPQSLLQGLVATITDRYYGLQSLALASVRERRNLTEEFSALPEVDSIASTTEQKQALARIWIGHWASSSGIWFQRMGPEWWQTRRGVQSHKGKFTGLDRWLGTPSARRVFERDWLPALRGLLCEEVPGGKYRLRASALTLDRHGLWAYCDICRTTQRPFPDLNKCINCNRETVNPVDPDIDPVFKARKGYYRASSVRALSTPAETPIAVIAAEHTAQLNAAQADEVFSKAEEHELLFQDVDLGISSPGQHSRMAIDVLSCTTTMEVGIDIGTLSGVALRNLPPSRANYQQRSGRAGRRGNAVATVIAFGSADSHDEHYFREPDAMIRGAVDDPLLTLDNPEIARRHVTAYLLQRYHHDRLPTIDPEDQPHLFEVLGTVDGFCGTDEPLNRTDFESWLRDNEIALSQDVDDWLPTELSIEDRGRLVKKLIPETLSAIDSALDLTPDVSPGTGDGKPIHSGEDELIVSEGGPEETDAFVVEAQEEEDEEKATPQGVSENLLNRLLYKGILPRYAFPTDVVGFHVFDIDRSTRYRAQFRYAPSQGLPVALTQYAPGKEVWIDGRLWTSGALYSPISEDRYRAWREKKLYFECAICRYATTATYQEAERGERRDCPACGGDASFGGAMNWIRPPGFAHPHTRNEGISPDDQPARSYATRAKLVAASPVEPESWEILTPRLREYFKRTHLLVTNTGPQGEGYTYCTRCGLIEPTAVPSGTISGEHNKPFPDPRDPVCQGSASTRGLVLGTDFISDVLLISLRVDAPLILRPGALATDVVLRTISEAMTIAATTRLDIDAGELQAEYRPALTLEGQGGLEAEIYIYDTLAGGAGFSRRVGQLGVSIFEDAIGLLENCPANCDYSCYRCLRSFKNRFEHDLLDRHLGASLLRYLVRGEEPLMAKSRLEDAVNRLHADLCRQGIDGANFLCNQPIDLPGIGAVEAPILASVDSRQLIIGVHGPLTPDHSADEALVAAKELGGTVRVKLLDEIVISRNLPHASQQVIDALV